MACVGDHACADGRVGGLVYENDAAGETVARVWIAEQRLGRAQANPADLVEPEFRRGFVRCSVFTLSR